MILKKFFRNILIWKIIYSILFLVTIFIFLNYLQEYKEESEFYKALYFSGFENAQHISSLYNELFEDYNYLVGNYNFLIEKANFTTVEPSKVRINFEVMNDSVRMFFNNSFFTSVFTNTGSMRPMIGVNTTCFFQSANNSDLVIGDVLAFKRSDNRTIAHRIINIDGDSVGWYAKTKGDNNLNRDSYLVRQNDIIGVLVACLY